MTIGDYFRHCKEEQLATDGGALDAPEYLPAGCHGDGSLIVRTGDTIAYCERICYQEVGF